VEGVYDDAYQKALQLRDEKGYTFIHPFDDEDVIAGQGTIALELAEQLPNLDAVLVPIGGGGLISGIAYTIKTINPNVKVYGVQATGAVTVNAARLEQYDASVYKIDTTVESVEAYYVADSEAKEKTQILDGLRYLPSYPYIAIHLEAPIETDFVINSFKYENGEMYITVQIFDREEMKEQYEFPSNLVVVSLQPHRFGLEISVHDHMPTNAWINVTFEYIS
jgi:hypothetical protein